MEGNTRSYNIRGRSTHLRDNDASITRTILAGRLDHVKGFFGTLYNHTLPIFMRPNLLTPGVPSQTGSLRASEWVFNGLTSMRHYILEERDLRNER